MSPSREAARPREMRPLWTREPLPQDRERKPPAPTSRLRKRPIPDKPVLSFHPYDNGIPTGRQDPSMPPTAFSRPSASEPSAISYREQQVAAFTDREIHDQCHDGYGDAQRRLRIYSAEHCLSSYPDTPCTDANDTSSALPDAYDSPVSHTSSSSPTPSDRSSGGADFTTMPLQVHASLPARSYGDHGYVPQPVVQVSYSHPFPQGYPAPYLDATYGRGGSHGVSGYPEDHGYSYA